MSSRRPPEYPERNLDQECQDALYEIPYDQREDWARDNRKHFFPDEDTQHPQRRDSDTPDFRTLFDLFTPPPNDNNNGTPPPNDDYNGTPLKGSK